MKKPSYFLWITISGIALALLALPKLMGKKEAEASPYGPGNKAMQQSAPVTAMVVRPQPFRRELNVPGSVIANERVQLAAEAAGRIVSLSLREGAHVKKGVLLVKINDADLQAQLEKAHAALKLAQDREKRQKALLAKNLISQEEYDISQKELTAGAADIELLKALIAKTEIRAPFDGRVGLRMVSEGAYLLIGAPVAEFVSTAPHKIEFSVPERYAAAVTEGAVLSFTVHGSDVAHTATVYARQSAIDEATRTLRVRARCTETGRDLLPGAFAEVRFPLSIDEHALLVPTQAIVPDMQGQNLFIVQNGKGIKRRVEVGERTGMLVQVTGGLRAGDTVITSGVLSVRPGGAVRVTKLETTKSGSSR
ncbi:MAG: efflux RND transporter periplasmic adaptor subunit [Chitinispirillaceae bacterium]|nr:efflux RND transporter periplasmic adaptor subunit [Chitinispirillaceae bacterium]